MLLHIKLFSLRIKGFYSIIQDTKAKILCLAEVVMVVCLGCLASISSLVGLIYDQ